MKRIPLLSAVFVIFLVSACSTAPKAPPMQSLVKDDYSLVVEYLQEYVPAQMKKHRFTGMSVALVDDQRVVWSEGFGFADKSADTRATASTRYRAGSVSKLFTAMAAMKLAQEDKLDLDAPITASVPEFALQTRFGSIDGITLRNMLSHHSGIPSAMLGGMWAHEPDSFKTVTTSLSRYYAAYPPNTVFAYSNAAFSVAGHAVENVSGMPFSEYMEKALLRPLDMSHSNFELDTSDARVSRSYWNGREVEELGLRDIPAGGLVTSVGDLGNLVKLVNANGFYKSQLFEPEILQEMLAVQADDSVHEPDGFNGIGWFNFVSFLDGKYKAVGHTGQTMAHSSSVVIVPELKLGVVLLSNSPSLGAGLEEITREILRVSHAVKTRKALSAVVAPDEAPRPLYGSEAGFDGQYASVFGYLDIAPARKGYELKIADMKMSLTGDDSGAHSLRARLLGFIPVKPPGLGDIAFFAREVSGEKVIYARQPGGRTSLIATEARTQERIPVWDARLGEYTITNPIESDNRFFQVDSATLDYADGIYRIQVKSPMGNQELPLTVINDTEVVLQGYGRSLGETMFFQDDGSLLYAGWVFVRSP